MTQISRIQQPVKSAAASLMRGEFCLIPCSHDWICLSVLDGIIQKVPSQKTVVGTGLEEIEREAPERLIQGQTVSTRG
jgi:hypothetical protein